MAPSDPLAEEVLETRYLYQGRILDLRVAKVALPNGRTAQREIVEHGEVAAIVPIDENGRVLLVRQFRIALGRETLEIPAGGLDPGEKPEEAAQRELQEETGYKAAQLHRLGGFYVSPGYCTEFIHVFLAQGLYPSGGHPADDEAIHPLWLPLPEALEMANTGRLDDAKTVIGLLWAARSLGTR